MAHVEPMDVESDFEDKENSLQLNNVLSRASCTEKGYEELDVSEISMKLRYSITPCASPMSKSCTGICRDSKFCDTAEEAKPDSFNNFNLTQSLNSVLSNADHKLSKITPLQPLPTDTFGDINRNPLSQRSVDLHTDPNITITLNDNDHLDNLSLPSTSSSNAHTPEATTPTKEIPKDGGSPILRGLKSVFSMFRSSQSPIPPPETAQPNIIDSSLLEEKTQPLTSLVSTPINVHKSKEMSPKRTSPLKDSIAFKDDLEKELLWRDETTIIFKDEKIPISKLFPKEVHSNGIEIKRIEKMEPNVSVEYMDISHNESAIGDKTMMDIESKLAGNVNETIGNAESDGEFVDCETTFTKCDVSQNFENSIYREDMKHSVVVNKQIEDCNVLTEQIKNNQVTEEEMKNNEENKCIEDRFTDDNEISEVLPETNVDTEEQTKYNQETKDETKSNCQIEEKKIVGTELVEMKVLEESVSEAVNKSVKDETIEYDKLIFHNQINSLKDLGQLEGETLQQQSIICADNTFNLSKHSNTSEYNVTDITIEDKQNALPIEEHLNTNNNTNLSFTLPGAISAIELIINENRSIADIDIIENKIDETLSKSLHSEIEHIIKENISEELLENTEINLDTVACNIVSKVSGDGVSLQNVASYCSETINSNELIVNISLFDKNNMEDIIKSTETQKQSIFSEEQIIQNLSSEITSVSNIISHSTNEQVSSHTDVPLPTDDESEQEIVTKNNIVIEEMCNDDSKICLNKNDDKNSTLLGGSTSINSQVCLNLSSKNYQNSTINSTKDIVREEGKLNEEISKHFKNIESQLDNVGQSSIQYNTKLSDTLDLGKEKSVSVCSDTKIDNEKECIISSAIGLVETNEQNSSNDIVVNHDNNEYQIISEDIIPEIDLKMEEVDEIITSAGTSPYVSVTEINLPDHEKDDLELVGNNLGISPPISPKPIKKGYNINFDDIDDPFATKTKIRLSPTPETPVRKPSPFDDICEKKGTDKKCDMSKNKQKLQEKKPKKGSKNLICLPKDKKHKFPQNNGSFDKYLSQGDTKISETEFDYDNSNIHIMNSTEVETSNIKRFDSTFDSVSNEFKELKDKHLPDMDLSSGDIGNITFNDTFDCLPTVNSQLTLKKNDTFNVIANGQDVNNGRTSQDDTTLDLLKDIKMQINDTTIENIYKNSAKELAIQDQGNKDITIQETYDDKSLTAGICRNIATHSVLEKDCTTIDGRNNDMIDVKNLKELKDNLTVLDTGKICSMTEFDINPCISEVKNNSALTDTDNKSTHFSHNCLNLELKNNFESSSSTDNTSLEKNLNFKLQQAEANFVNEEHELFPVKNSILTLNANISTENDKTITSVVADEHNSPYKDQEVLKISPSNLSIATTSSKNSDGDITVKEILTEDEDTIEGPFLEDEDFSDEINVQGSDSGKKNMLQFEFPPPLTNIANADNDELFIDAEAFEFLLNQNKTNVIADSGKESLFLKFDPLFAKRLSSDGILAALSKIQKRQSTPKKVTKVSNTENIQNDSPQPGPSNINTLSNEMLDHLELPSQAKPMMVVNPAVNPIASPRKVTPKLNRRSLTFTSPAIAVIDRLLSLNGDNSFMDQNQSVPHVDREYSETEIAITQLRELLAEKEIHVHNLRCESKELQDRLANLESQMKNLETESGDRVKKINTLNERLAEKTKINKSMALVVEEYERTIASLISDIEQDKKRNAEERMKLVMERDEQTAHLASMEVSFSDLHSKYEKSKQIILSMKANEDKCKSSLKDFEDSLAKMQSNYEFLKQHATSKLNHANQELEKINKTHESEVLKLNALIKRKELHITSLEETLMQKTKANEELTAICDELINKVG